jgi:hypothetical protein
MLRPCSCVTVFCMPSSLHRFFSRERKRKKCSDGAPVRFFRAALSGVWDLPCSDSFLLTPILVLSQSRLCLRGPVVCVVELAARISGRCRRCRQRAKRCNGLLSALPDKTEDADACRLDCSACVVNTGLVALRLTTGVVCVSDVDKSVVSAARCTRCGWARRCLRDRVCTTATTDKLYDKLLSRLALASALSVARVLPPPPLPRLALSHTHTPLV